MEKYYYYYLLSKECSCQIPISNRNVILGDRGANVWGVHFKDRILGGGIIWMGNCNCNLGTATFLIEIGFVSTNRVYWKQLLVDSTFVI